MEPAPNAFRLHVVDVRSFGIVEYNYGDDGLDNYEDTLDETLADFVVEGSLDDAFDALRVKLAEVAPGRGPFHYNGEFVSTSPKPKCEDRIDILVTDASAESDFSIWLFSTLDIERPEIDRLVAKLAA